MREGYDFATGWGGNSTVRAQTLSDRYFGVVAGGGGTAAVGQ